MPEESAEGASVATVLSVSVLETVNSIRLTVRAIAPGTVTNFVREAGFIIDLGTCRQR